jgi:hypothetical protein
MVESSLHLTFRKILFSAFTFLRNSKALWYVPFMVIRHKREKDKVAERKRSGGGKTCRLKLANILRFSKLEKQLVSLN